MINPLANVCISLNNAISAQKQQVLIRRICKVSKMFLESMQKHGYIEDIAYIHDKRQGKVVVNLSGKLNRCGVICPRYDVTMKEIERYRASVLPSRAFGHLILTTSKGVIDHRECQKHNTGGKLVGFFY